MNTLSLVRFHDKLIRQELIPSYIDEYLLCNGPKAREVTDDGELYRITCDKLILTKIDK